MKRIYLIIILSCVYFSVSYGQSLVDQIERAYNTLDSTSYINNVILSYAKSLDELNEESRETFLQTLRSDGDSARNVMRYHRLDSIYSVCKILNTQYVKKLENDMKARTPFYILNLKLKDEQTLQVDTGKLNFNLFYFGEKSKEGLYVYCYDGAYDCHTQYYYTFSRKIAKNFPKVFERIIRKHPKYLLLCSDLEGANTILYVLNNEIYIYQVAQMKEYKLDYYMKHRSTIDTWKSRWELVSSAATYGKLVSDNFNSSRISVSYLSDPANLQDLRNRNGLIHTNLLYNNSIRYSDILRSIQFYHSGKIIMKFRIGSYNFSSVDAVDNNWWFYVLRGLK